LHSQTVAYGPPLAKFAPPLAQTSSYATGANKQ